MCRKNNIVTMLNSIKNNIVMMLNMHAQKEKYAYDAEHTCTERTT